MVKVVTLALTTSLSLASAVTVNFINQCSYTIQLYHSQSGSSSTLAAEIDVGSNSSLVVTGPANMFRHTTNNSATLLEMAIDSTVWYDISIIPPMPGNCDSYEACIVGGKTGFNVPLSVEPSCTTGKGTCSSLYCAADDPTTCSDAYLFPDDNTKTHSCPTTTDFTATFCYADASTTQQTTQQSTPSTPSTTSGSTSSATSSPSSSTTPSSPTTEITQVTTQVQGSSSTGTNVGSTLGTVKAKYSYTGEYAGNVAGSYNRVTDLASCTKESVSLNDPVGPLSEQVTMIFRGPMEIENIAVFTAQSNSSWSRVSSYSRSSGTVENLTFMNNKNVDYSGKNKHGPQGYASSDGQSLADTATVFAGVLADASDPSQVGAGPGISTGTEINILTGSKCNGECPGFSGDNDYQGWDGGMKAFVTEVKMPQGSSPNRPAIWMLNAQVVHSNQYGCNCRGMGPVGGCGELDIAEVIETNIARDEVSTHFYLYDGSILSPGGDNFAPRSYDSTTVYITLIDNSSNGLIKIVEVDSFDFSITELGSIYDQLVQC